MARSARFLGFLAVLPIAWGVAPGVATAGGWQEAHQTSDDVRITVASDGTALVEHHLRWRVVAGKFKSFEVAGIDPRAELVGSTTATSDKGVEVAGRVEPNAKIPGTVRIDFDEPKGIGRGSYVLDVKYKLDLVATKILTTDGAMSLLSWTSPPSPEGHDGARVVFVLPPGPTEPRLASPEQAQTTMVTLRRTNEHDELELVRAHVPRGEAAVWSARVDAKVFAKLAAPEAKPRKIAAPPEDDRARTALVVLAFASIAGVLAWLLGQKRAGLAAACEARGAVVRPLVPLPLAPFVYGLAGSGALAALLFGTPLYGALLAVFAMGVAAHRGPVRRIAPRGPGRWLAVDDASLVTPPPAGDPLDLTTRRGALVFAAVVAVLGALAMGLRTKLPGISIALPLAASVLVPVFATGTRSQLPRSPAELGARFFLPVRNALGTLVDLAHAELRTLARVREGTRAIDEVRLSCRPGDPVPGLRAVEVALAEGEPEVLVRWTDGSHAGAKIAALAPGLRVVPGRSPEEKVLRLVPARPTAAAAARLVAKLLAELEGRRGLDRREPPASYRGPERRAVPLAA